MSSITIRRTWEVNDVLTDPTTLFLRDATNTYGIKRADNSTVVVSPGAVFTKVSTGIFEHTASGLDEGVTYIAATEILYLGNTHRFSTTHVSASAQAASEVATWGGNASNTYIAFTGANSFIEASIVEHSAWTAASTVTRVAALLEATRDIDARSYVGKRKYSDQLLEFPRDIYGRYPSGNYGSSSYLSTLEARMKLSVERAACHQALYIVQQSGKNAHLDNVASGLKSVRRQVGPIEEEYQYNDGSSVTQRTLCRQALTLLSNWLSTRRIIRG